MRSAGLMGLATDATGIQFRLLGRSKGPALWSPRAQCDKAAYATWMQQALMELPGLDLIQGEAWTIERDDAGRVCALGLRDGRQLRCGALVVTTGTFLRGLLHQGETQTAGGRMGDQAASGLSAALAALGLSLLRHKTGTPCRLHARGIRWDLCTEQPGDDPPPRFSFTGAGPQGTQLPCWSCRTTPEAHAIIRANVHRAPMYNGQISSVGPRYCPSIEDKVVRFGDRDEHHLFLEPEGRTTHEIYVNGLSTSLPIDVQQAVLAAIPELAQAHVLRFGYAVEYDVVAPDQIDHSLAARSVPGLYLAGQINGTSGYEEAAAQGVIAGANAALDLAGRAPLRLSRADAYLGVLVDDLVTRLPEEPYRMFTARAEHRLHLRAGNADRRLAPLAARAGLISAERAAAVAAKDSAVRAAVAAIDDTIARRIAGEGLELDAARALAPLLNDLPADIAVETWTELRYSGYLQHQQARIERLQRQRDLPLPADLDFDRLTSLSAEGRRVLTVRRPRTLGEAERLPGVRQGDVELLWAVLQARTA